MLSETRQTQTKTACSSLDVQPRKVDSIEVKVTIVATRGRKGVGQRDARNLVPNKSRKKKFWHL